MFILSFQGTKGLPGEQGPPGPDGTYIFINLIRGDKGERGPRGKDGIPCDYDVKFEEIIGIGERGLPGEPVNASLMSHLN